MPRPKRKTKAEDLARVRRNQRKSRERRKERVMELEQRVEQLEAAATESSAQRLGNENRALRGLLDSLGFDGVSLNRYLQGSGGTTGDQMGGSEVQALALAPDSSEVQFMGGLSTISGITSDEITLLESVSLAELDLDHAMQNRFDPLSSDHFQMNLPWSLPTEQAPADLSMTEDLAGMIRNMDGVTGSIAGSVDNETTLCSIAFHLIVQCNRSGKDVLELETKLRYGYKMPALPGEGCRVDNRTLLAVLAELV